MYMYYKLCTCITRYVHVLQDMYIYYKICTCITKYVHVLQYMYMYMYYKICTCTCITRYILQTARESKQVALVLIRYKKLKCKYHTHVQSVHTHIVTYYVHYKLCTLYTV